MNPIPTEKAEELINYYVCLRHQLAIGDIPKVGYPLSMKAKELGFSLTTAWRLVEFARNIGVVEGKIC